MEEKVDKYGIKELEFISIKATNNIEIGNKVFEKDETVLYFDKANVAFINESMSIVSARGGRNNYSQVFWESPRDLTITFSNGLMSETSLAMAMCTGLIEGDGSVAPISISCREVIDAIGEIKTLKGKIKSIFVYIKDGENKWIRFTDFTIDNDKIVVATEYSTTPLLVDYYYEYSNDYKQYDLSTERLSNCLRLEAQGVMKDVDTGESRKIYFVVPKVRLQSNLNIRLGDKMSPSVMTFRAIGMPVSEDGKKLVSKIYLLADEEEVF